MLLKNLLGDGSLSVWVDCYQPENYFLHVEMNGVKTTYVKDVFINDDYFNKVDDQYALELLDIDFYYRGYKTIKFINSSKIMIALNNDKKVKYNHIVTCRVPLDLNEATTLTALTYLK